MTHDNPQTERETADNEAGILSRTAYVDALSTLTWQQLKQECLKQYDMSGEMLDKYRRWNQVATDRQNRIREIQAKHSRHLRLMFEATTAMQSAVERFSAIQLIEQESAGYTQNAKFISRRLVHDIAQSAIDKLKSVLKTIHDEANERLSDLSDIPF